MAVIDRYRGDLSRTRGRVCNGRLAFSINEGVNARGLLPVMEPHIGPLIDKA